MEQLYKYLIYYYPNKSEEILTMLNMLDKDTISFLTSISVSILPLHPFAFAMASGVGSASMDSVICCPFLWEYISSCFWLCHSLKNYIQF